MGSGPNPGFGLPVELDGVEAVLARDSEFSGPWVLAGELRVGGWAVVGLDGVEAVLARDSEFLVLGCWRVTEGRRMGRGLGSTALKRFSLATLSFWSLGVGGCRICQLSIESDGCGAWLPASFSARRLPPRVLPWLGRLHC